MSGGADAGDRAAAARGPRIDPRAAAGWIIAAVCLGTVLRHVDLASFVRQIRSMDPAWAALAVALDVAAYLTQGRRWSALLVTVGPFSTYRATQAIYAGLFVNEVVPLRAGEAVRALAAARCLEQPVAKVLPSMVVERALDGVCLAAAVAAVALFVRLPRSFVAAEEALAIGMVALVLVLAALAGRVRSPAPSAAGGGLRARIAEAMRELARIGAARVGTGAILSAAFLALQGAAMWAALRAFGIPVQPVVGFAVACLVRLGTALPAAPSNLGTYQLSCVLALELFGVDAPRAAGFSLAGFLLLTAPLWLLGTAALAGTGLTLADVRRRGSLG